MEIKINLDTIEPKGNKQKFYLRNFLKAIEYFKDKNDFTNMIKQLNNYKDYVKTIKGEKNRFFNNILDNFEYKKAKIDPLSHNKNKYLKLMNECYELKSHLPKKTDLGKWIGVEIECFIPRSGDIESFEDIENLLKDEKIKYCDIKHDGSIRETTGAIPAEFTILTKIDDMSNLLKLCKFLNNCEALVNQSCGLHIHLDQRDVYKGNTISQTDEMNKELRSRVMRLNQCLGLLASAVPKSRRENSYCQVVKARLKQRGRYYAINTSALRRYNTIEIRLHSGTTDYVKISNWIKLLFEISRCSKIKNSNKHIISTIEQLKEKYLTDMPLDMFNYFVQRVNKFKDNTVNEENSHERTTRNINEYMAGTSDDIISSNLENN